MGGEVLTRRWNDPPAAGDGLRLLICRYRPRGLCRGGETWDDWWRDLAPSRALHAAYYGKPGPPIGLAEYRRRFLEEMEGSAARDRLRALRERIAAGETVTLLCSSACVDPDRCHRTLVRNLVLAGRGGASRT